jgi:hypothetical protein
VGVLDHLLAPVRAGQGRSRRICLGDDTNREGVDGGEAVGMTALADGSFAVLLKRPVAAGIRNGA